MSIEKYDIYVAIFPSKEGSAQAGKRPCVIVQSNLFNIHAQTMLVVPLTTTKMKLFPSEFLIAPSMENGLHTTSRFLGSQIITLDRSFLSQKLGHLERIYAPLIKEALSISLDIEDDF